MRYDDQSDGNERLAVEEEDAVFATGDSPLSQGSSRAGHRSPRNSAVANPALPAWWMDVGRAVQCRKGARGEIVSFVS